MANLVLQRDLGQTVVIGEEMVRITVVDLTPEGVRLMFTADPSVAINRGEVYRKLLESRVTEVAGQKTAEELMAEAL